MSYQTDLEALQGISDKLDTLNQNINAIYDLNSNMDTNLAAGKTFLEPLPGGVDGITEKLGEVIEVITPKDPVSETLDYTKAINDIANLLAYTDLLLIILLIFLVIATGILTGSLVTRWLKSRKEE